jgi:dihydrofolate synthase/folylpolyglutamate synthase
LSDRVKAKGAQLWLDGAHNPHAIATIVPALDRLRIESASPLCIVLGLLTSKDAPGILENLKALQPFRLIVTDFNAAPAAKAETLAALAHSAGLAVEAAPSLTAAMDLALVGVDASPIIVVCGSLYLAGELLRMAPSAWPS